MEIRIGIKHSPRELAFETATTADELRALIEEASTKDRGLVALSDNKGKQYLVDAGSITYVEFGGDTGRKVGFIS
jgi:hypothetical protein